MKKLPKIKFRANLEQILPVILIVAVVLEGFVLYRTFYAPVDMPSLDEALAPETGLNVSLDLVQFDKIKSWIEESRAYQLPEYDLSTSTASTSSELIGRENPFAE